MTIHSNNHANTSETVMSDDGTVISYQTTGSGPGLILIHGVLSMAVDYNNLAAELGKSFTVYSLERRGRGLSGSQGEDYQMEKECEDVSALQKKTGAMYLVGHSYGGLIALETARYNHAFKKVAVYEPGVSVDGAISMVWVDKYQKYLTDSKYLDALCVFSIETAPGNAKATPLWLMRVLLPLIIKKNELQKMYKLLAANLNEHIEVANKNNTYENYRSILADVLLMFGGKSNLKWVKTAVAALSNTVPSIELREFPKLDHFGPDKTGPTDVAGAIEGFFLRG